MRSKRGGGYVPRIGRSSVAIMMALLAWQAPAWAQSTSAVTLPPVLVHGGKQAPRAWEATASSVSVLSAEELDWRLIDHGGDLAQQLPNVYFTRFAPTGQALSIRGMGFSDDEADSRSGSVVLDGVTVFGLAADGFFDLEQVELMRGPQGTLYGQNSQAGLLMLRSRPAQQQAGGQLRLEAGNDQQHGVEGAWGGRVQEDLAWRAALRLRRANGPFEDRLSGRKDGGAKREETGRLKLLQRFSGGATLDLGLHLARQRNHYNLFAKRELAEQLHTETGEPGRADGDFAALIARVDVPLQAGSRLTSLSAWVQADDLQQMPPRLYSALTEFRQREQRLSQEFRLQGGEPGREWLAGAYLAQGKRRTPNLFDASPYFRSATEAQVQHRSAAVFGQLNLALAPGWSLMAGLRAEATHRQLDWRGDLLTLIDSNGDGRPDMPYTQNESLKDHKIRSQALLPSLTLNHAVAQGQQLHLSLSRGYRPAGFNISASQLAQAQAAYRKEWAQQLELGWRGQWQSWARWSLTGFQIQMRDQQVSTVDERGLMVTRNAARSKSSGIEAELQVRLSPRWELSAQAGTVRARFEHYFDGSQDRSGQQFPNTPRYSAGGQVRWKGSDGWHSHMGLQRIGASRLFPAADEHNAAYTLVNAGIGRQWGDWTFSLNAKNLNNARYFVRALPRGRGWLAGEPRSLALRADRDF